MSFGNRRFGTPGPLLRDILNRLGVHLIDDLADMLDLRWGEWAVNHAAGRERLTAADRLIGKLAAPSGPQARDVLIEVDNDGIDSGLRRLGGDTLSLCIDQIGKVIDLHEVAAVNVGGRAIVGPRAAPGLQAGSACGKRVGNGAQLRCQRAQVDDEGAYDLSHHATLAAGVGRRETPSISSSALQILALTNARHSVAGMLSRWSQDLTVAMGRPVSVTILS